MNTETRICQNCKREFAIEPEDFDFYKKINVPPPTWCWRCRAVRRMSFRNLRYLYERKCAATGKKIFSLLPPEAPMPPYDREYWMSDAWDAITYGRDYDFSRPFFEQIKELFNAVPYTYVFQQSLVNSDYSMGGWLKNCYLCFDAGYSEDSGYGVTLQRSRQCYDSINFKSCELCYFGINCTDCFKTHFSRNCVSCNEVWFSQDCVGCNNCFGCTGLRNKSYYIFNEPHDKEAYLKKIDEIRLNTWSGLQRANRQAQAVFLKYPVRYQHSAQATGCTGDYIYQAAELRNCFFAGRSQNCAHSQSIVYGPIRDSMDVTSSGDDIELDYEISCCGISAHKTFFSFDCAPITNSQYSITCRQVSDVFGCVGLKSKQYCILNKQYTKDEYREMIPRIIQHMNDMPYVDAWGRVYKYGEFFPPDVSPWGYNETQAYEYFPMTQEETERLGSKWHAPETKKYKVSRSASDLPETIREVSDDVVKDIIRCAHDETGSHPGYCGANCATAFRIIPQELQFYRQLNLPLPRLCFNCRHVERIGWRNAPQLYKRKCMCVGAKSSNSVYANSMTHFHGPGPCPNKFETSYAPDRSEIVYCEQCYNAEVI